MSCSFIKGILLADIWSASKIYRRLGINLISTKWIFALTLEVHLKLLLMLRLTVTVILKIMEQIALIPSHLLALHLQRKYARVARIKDTTVLYPQRENTRRAGRRISVGCTMMRITKEPFARSASNLEFLVFSVLEGLRGVGHKTLQKLEESC